MADDREHEAMDVRDWLANVAPPPLDFDIDSIVRDGRTAVRRRRYVVAGTTIAIVLALVAVPAAITFQMRHNDQPTMSSSQGTQSPAPSQCTSTILQAPETVASKSAETLPSFTTTGMDPTGRYVIGTVGTIAGKAEAPLLPILWTDLVPAIIPVSWSIARPTAVNRNGVVVGEGSLRPNDGNTFSWIYASGKSAILPAPSGYSDVTATAITDEGDVVGMATDTKRGVSVGIYWRAAQPRVPQLIMSIDKRLVTNTSVREDGTPIAWDNLNGAPAYWNTTGQPRPLPMPAGTTTAVITAARGTWAVGVARRRSASTSAQSPDAIAKGLKDTSSGVLVRWNLAADTVEIVKDGDREITGVNTPQGRMFTVNAQGNVTVAYPYSIALRGNQRLVLPTPDGASPNPVGMSDDGTAVVGTALMKPSESTGPTQPILWHC